MKDKFEEFVRNSQAEFDIREPRPELWKGIEDSISHKKVIRWRFYLSRAAAVILIFTASIIAQRVWMNVKDNIAEYRVLLKALPEEMSKAEELFEGV